SALCGITHITVVLIRRLLPFRNNEDGIGRSLVYLPRQLRRIEALCRVVVPTVIVDDDIYRFRSIESGRNVHDRIRFAVIAGVPAQAHLEELRPGGGA